jgi:hypothetical protein
MQRIFGRWYVMYIIYANCTLQVRKHFKITGSLDVGVPLPTNTNKYRQGQSQHLCEN